MKDKVLNIYCDGGARGNPGPAASAFVVKENNTIVYKQAKFIGVATNNSAEYSAVYMALKWLSENPHKEKGEVVFFLDSELVTKQLLGEYKIKNENLRNYYYKVKKLEKAIKNKIIYKNIPRNKNRLSDYLVNEELDKVV